VVRDQDFRARLLLQEYIAEGANINELNEEEGTSMHLRPYLSVAGMLLIFVGLATLTYPLCDIITVIGGRPVSSAPQSAQASAAALPLARRALPLARRAAPLTLRRVCRTSGHALHFARHLWMLLRGHLRRHHVHKFSKARSILTSYGKYTRALTICTNSQKHAQ
jgi:hypothetical protein